MGLICTYSGFKLILLQIHAKDVHFWWKFRMPRDLVLACVARMYPPRFTLEVSARSATESVCMEVDFKGPKEDVSTEIQLEYDPRKFICRTTYKSQQDYSLNVKH